jgi:hypothetical protein
MSLRQRWRALLPGDGPFLSLLLRKVRRLLASLSRGGSSAQAHTTFYKTNEFWGTAGTAVAFILAAVGFAVTGHVVLVKWLSVGALLLLAISCWCAFGKLAAMRRIVYTFISSMAIALLLGWAYSALLPVRATDSDNVAEGIWFGINMDASKALVQQFRAVDPALLKFYNGTGSVNTIDNLPSEYYGTAWRSTFSKLLVCDADNNVGSGMTFLVSQHPSLLVLLTNNAVNGSCVLGASLLTPPATGAVGFILVGDGSWPHHHYTLDLPVWNDRFGIRIFVSREELVGLGKGYSPLWRSFAIDDPEETLQLQVHKKGSQWTALTELDQVIPSRIRLKTDLLFGGPQIVREYRLVSTVPRQVARGDDASQTFFWGFTWRRTRYAEERSAFGRSN